MADPDKKMGGGLLSRLAAGLGYAVSGRVPDQWFGPGPPSALAAAPVPQGRQFDYPVGFNLRIEPRQDEVVSFAQLRQLADHWDMLRLVIETRKDQMEKLIWRVRGRADLPVPVAGNDPRLDRLKRFFENPDGEHGWHGWLRMVLEDLFVIDAPTLYVRRDLGGEVLALEIVDGATIKRVIDGSGRTPMPPDPAYQQVLHGIPAVDYGRDALIYAPRNLRPHKIYGYSPVEQILVTINIALRRQASQLAYYTEGNTPEALIGVPETWSADQIREFQEYWDDLLAGNQAIRRHTRFVPGGLKYQAIREPPLKDAFDEWLARLTCFAFSISPTALMGQVNRATAQTTQQTAMDEGIGSLRIWLKNLMDRIIHEVFAWPDLEFSWVEETPLDPAQQAQINVAYVKAGIKTVDEVRHQLGLPPLSAPAAQSETL